MLSTSARACAVVLLLVRLLCVVSATSYISSFSDAACTQLLNEWGMRRPALVLQLSR